jgi:hypothetical protein
VATDKELVGYARDCVRLARMTDDPTISAPLMKMAREWMDAAHGEQRSKFGAVSARVPRRKATPAQKAKARRPVASTSARGRGRHAGRL